MGYKIGQIFANFVTRGIFGICAIFLTNQILNAQEIPIMVGLNLCTFLTAGTLGIPGVGLLYGIMFYQFL